MKDYGRIIGKITSTPWMITDDALKMILEIFEKHMNGEVIDFPGEPATHSYASRQGNVGIMKLHGPIFPKANMMTDMSGATSLEQFRSDFRDLMSDSNVASLLLDVDSPGGISDHVEETAQEIRAARDIKPIYAIANTAMNSAAYYLGSQATKLYATPSAQVGSIGTYTVHKDDSVRQELLGVKQTVIKAGRFKAAMNTPLTDETHEHLQALVNATNDNFIKSVALGRNTTEDDVRANYGEGGIVPVPVALESGMIDGIVTYDALVDSLSHVVQYSQNGSIVTYVPTAASNQTSIIVPSIFTDTTTGTNPWRQSYDADKEHSEPGTGLGGEPTPREPPEKGDKAIEGGWRRDPPPIAYETEEWSVTRTWMEERATILGISFSDETTDDELAENVKKKMDEIVVPLNEATEEATKQRQFEAEFPEQAAQFAELLNRDRDNSARTFAEGYAKFEGSNKGFSTLVRDRIAEAHAQISVRQFSHANLADLLDLISQSDGIVTWGEQGSSRSTETELPSTDFSEARNQFAQLVRNAMTEDNLSQSAAIDHVAKQNPELANAYMYGHAVR